MANAVIPVAPGSAVRAPTNDELDAVFRSRFGDPATTGPVPKLWHRFGYYPPDLVYEAFLDRLVRPGISWMDVGCGRQVLPNNIALGEALARRCERLVGVDPDPTIEENPFVHARVRCPIEEFETDDRFDLITLRMVAEHIRYPAPVLATLARLTKPGGHVVVLTVNRWSPVSVAAGLVPFRLHHAAKRLVWGTEERDTFPVAYRMNTRRRLRRLFEGHGFGEAYFARVADCRVFYRQRPLHRVELAVWRMLSAVGVTYPENCLLGVYERAERDSGRGSDAG